MEFSRNEWFRFTGDMVNADQGLILGGRRHDIDEDNPMFQLH